MGGTSIVKFITTLLVGGALAGGALAQQYSTTTYSEENAPPESVKNKWTLIIALSGYDWTSPLWPDTSSEMARFLIAFEVQATESLSFGGWWNRDMQRRDAGQGPPGPSTAGKENYEFQELHASYQFLRQNQGTVGVSVGRLATTSDVGWDQDWWEVMLVGTAFLGPQDFRDKFSIGASYGRGFSTGDGNDCDIWSLCAQYMMDRTSSINVGWWVQDVESGELIPSKIERWFIGVGTRF